MMKPILFAAILGAAALPASAIADQGSQAPAADTEKGLAKQDRDFFEDASMGGLFEVRAGELAMQRATMGDVKSFAQRMINDHTTVNDKLAAVAKQKGLVVPSELDKKHKDKIDKLQKKTGGDFDKEYIEMMVNDHEDDVKAFQKEAKDGKDADIRQLATATLPTLEEHLSLAKQTENIVKKTR
jgi:putative membrane protein